MSLPSVASIDESVLFAPAKQVEPVLEALLKGRSLPRNLRDAARYSLLGPGKRLRPILVIRCCQAAGGSPAQVEQALLPAAAIEMIHCFSLIHDDLPALDNDDLRRGRPTLHKAAGEAMAILTGDLLLGLALEVLSTQAVSELALSLVRELTTATNDMIAGQVYDTLPDFEAAVAPLERLKTIHKNKTGALIRCACRMGAIVAHPKDYPAGPKLRQITHFAELIGLMFQVMDDLLDVTQTTEQLGKTAGKDVQQNKMTYPALIGVDTTRAEVQRLHQEALAALEPLGPAAEHLRQLCRYMAVRSK